jgi:L-gulonate 5-dehydrogenase
MKALVYTQEKTLVFQDYSDPKLAQGDVLIKVESVGICGSDMHAFLGHDSRRFPPLILGHEAAGVIVEGLNKGTRVTVNPLVTCDVCDACLRGRNNICSNRQLISMAPREGAFAEYLAIPYKNIITIPDNVNISHAALTEPVACGWHAVKLGITALDIPIKKAKCLIIGGGAIGMGVALSLNSKGATNITVVDNNSARRGNLAKTSEVDLLITDEINQSVEYDLVFDAVGYSSTRSVASQACKPGGVIVHIGLGDSVEGLDVRRMTLQEITFIGTYTYTPKDFQETALAIFNSEMGSFKWVEERFLKDGHKAFTDILSGQVAASKIILKP